MSYSIILDKDVTKFLDVCDDHIARKFYVNSKILASDPYTHQLDIKKMKHSNNQRRMRIGEYRFIYEVYQQKLIIFFVDADSRGDIYK